MTWLTPGVLAAACSGSNPAETPVPSPQPSASPVSVTKVMPLGDSITQARNDRNSYRRSLWHQLQATGFAVDFVGSLTTNHQGPPPAPDFDLDHEGHWGWTADEVLAEIDAWAARGRPDVVLLHLGSNDMLRGHDVRGTLDELAGIVGALRGANPRVVVLLAQLIPVAQARVRSRIEALNAGIPALAARLSSAVSPVEVVDHFTGFDPEADTSDGVHPNGQGEEKMAATWLRALKPALAAAPGRHE